MGVVAREINVIKMIKKDIDSKGMQNFDKLNKVFAKNKYIMGFNIYIETKLVDWKTSIVEISDDAFYIGLDLKKSIRVELSMRDGLSKYTTLADAINNLFYDENKGCYGVRDTDYVYKTSDIEVVKTNLKSVYGNYSSLCDGIGTDYKLNVKSRYSMIKSFTKQENLIYYPLFIYNQKDVNVLYYPWDGMFIKGNNTLGNVSLSYYYKCFNNILNSIFSPSSIKAVLGLHKVKHTLLGDLKNSL